LRRRLGQSGPWPAELYRHVQRVAAGRGLDPMRWLEQVEQSPRELSALIAAATVGHTAFFRHPEHFNHLKEFAQRAAMRAPLLRVWCAGCSTGEEAWSLALCLSELSVPFSILATDVNARSIELARAGSYPARATLGLPGYAGKLPWRAPDALRKHVRFETLGLLEPLPSDEGPRHDVIFCRNLLIYLEPAVLDQAWRRFLMCLEPWGAVTVSPVESLSQVPPELEHAGPLGWFERAAQPRLAKLASVRPVRKPSIVPAPAPSDEIDQLLDRAAQNLSNGQTADAERELHQVLEKRDDAVGWFLLGEACARRGEATQARIAYRRATSAAHAPANVDLETIREAARRRARQLQNP
jgi:chemotaxis protein methyltransferase CheR